MKKNREGMMGIFDTLKSAAKNIKALPALTRAGKEALKVGGAAAFGSASATAMADKNVVKLIDKGTAMALEKGETAAAQGVFDKGLAIWKKNRIPVAAGGVVFVLFLGWTIKRAFFGKK